MALYNGGFPATYQNPYMQYQPVQQTQQQPQGSIIWVSGEAGAKSFLVAPNTSVVLFDSEGETVYIKSADASGMPSMKILDYTIRENVKNAPVSVSQPTPSQLPDYATKADLNAVYAKIKGIEERLSKEEEHA